LKPVGTTQSTVSSFSGDRMAGAEMRKFTST
jgi:hypothetical protein